MLSKSIFAKTHHGAQRKFHEHFVLNKEFPVEYGMILTNLSSLRQAADYDYESKPSLAQAEGVVKQAEQFLHYTIAYFQSL